MGGSIAGGLVRSGIVKAENLTVTAKTDATLAGIGRRIPGIVTLRDNAAAVKDADLVILAVKPWQIEAVADEIRDSIDLSSVTIASVVAGISFRRLAEIFGAPAEPEKKASVKPAMLRIIPNTAISLLKSTTFISRQNVGDSTFYPIKAAFEAMGNVIEVEEDMMAAGTSIASCGIAYALKYIDAAVRGGETIGFRTEDARNAVINTMEGAIALLRANGSMPQEEIDKVTTPGGYTFKGLEAMEEAGFSDAVLQGLLKSM